MKSVMHAETAYAALEDEGKDPGTGNVTQEKEKQIETIAEELGVSQETAVKIQSIAEELGVPVETVLLSDETITNQKTEDDVKGSSFARLQLKASKEKTKSVKLTWKKVKGADGYQVFGARCGQKMKLVKTIGKGSKTTYTKKGLKKGKPYKFIVRAYKAVDGKKITIAASKTLHVYTDGGKYGNAKSVTVNKKKVKIVEGKKVKVKSTLVKVKKKLKKHGKTAVRYESSNTKVATVTRNGEIKARAKGTCTVYAYAQNGVYKKIKVTVVSKTK